jgi:hypothetical protein
VHLVAGAFIEPGLRASQRRADAGEDASFEMNKEKRMAHLDPAPDDREEGGCVDDGDRVERFWIVGSGEFRGLLEVAAKGPHQTKGDTAEVNNRSRCCDRR